MKSDLWSIDMTTISRIDPISDTSYDSATSIIWKDIDHLNAPAHIDSILWSLSNADDRLMMLAENTTTQSTGDPTIIVTATRPPTILMGGGFLLGSIPGGTLTPGPGPIGGPSGNPGVNANQGEAAPRLTPTQERGSDNAAWEAAQQILSFSDNSIREYATAIYRKSDGSIGFGPWSIDGSGTRATLMWPADISAKNVIGWIHNHPSGVPNQLTPTFPSSHDYQNINELARWVDKGGGNPFNLRMYILGNDNVLRQYNYGGSALVPNDIIIGAR
jgi:hypothetical protein